MRYVSLLLFICTFAPASNAAGISRVVGEINSDHATDLSDLRVELQPASGLFGHIERADVGYDGRFETGTLPEGPYSLSVVTSGGKVVYKELLTVHPNDRHLHIKVSIPETTSKPDSGVVSLQELTHVPPKAARKAFEKAVRMKEQGDHERAIALFRKAIEIDPEYMHAINDLGARYLVLGRVSEAAEMFQRAAKIDPNASLVQANLAHAFIYLRNLPGAEAAARRALDLDKSDLKAQYFLGLSLIMQGKFTQEAVVSLRHSESFSDKARLALGLALVKTGAGEEARRPLKSCLASEEISVRQEAARLLATLR